MASNSVETSLITMSLAPSMSLGMAETAMGNSISLLMQNATTNEHNGQLIATASTTQCCALMIAVGAAKAAG